MEKLIEELRNVIQHYDNGSNTRKKELLIKLSKAKISSLKNLRAYHDCLLFLSAYPPPNIHVEELLTAELQSITGLISREDKWRAALTNSGIALTNVESNFSLPIVQWMNERYGKEVKLLSINPESSFSSLALSNLLSLAEKEILEAGIPSLHSWLKKLSQNSGRRELDLLLNLLKSTNEENAELIFEGLKAFTTWNLSPGASLTFNRGLSGNIFYHDTELIKKPDESLISKPLSKQRPLSQEEKERLLTSARNTLCCHLRETDPITYAEDVELIRLERGYDIALFYMKPANRLGLESYIGYMAYKNSVPYAYGGGWVFLKRCKIGINVFPFVRGGESSYFMQQLMRVYHKLFGATTFIAEPYQVGKGNPDGIESGAFWFYYRLGFTPENDELNQLAKKIFNQSRSKNNLLKPEVLKKLAENNIVKHIKKSSPSFLPDPYLINTKLTSFISRDFEGDRRQAETEAAKQLRKFSFPPAKKKEVIKAYAPLLLAMKCSSWANVELQNLFLMLYEKCQGSEKIFIQLATKHRKFISEINKLQKS